MEDVLDATEHDTASDKTKKTYKMISMCNENNGSSLMFTPSHGKRVFAAAVITGIHGDTLFAENVETLTRGEKDKLTKAIRQEMTIATRFMQHTISDTRTPWNETCSPLAAQMCRVFAKSPTGPELEALHISTAKKARTD